MKFLALFLLLSLVRAQDDCQTCKASVKTLLDSLQTFEEMLAIEQALVNIVCLQLPDEAHESCGTGMYAWYPVVTRALFGYQGFTDGICTGIGLCDTYMTTKLPENCDDCENFLNGISTLLQTDDFSYATTEALKGEVYCDNPAYMPAMQAPICKDIMDLVGIKFIKGLGQVLGNASPRLCIESGCTK